MEVKNYMNANVTFEEMYNLIINESKRNSHNIKVSKLNLLKALKKSQKNILKKYNEAKEFWNQTVKIYQEFLTKCPGSTQMRAPDSMPRLPFKYDDLLGYIQLVSTFSDEELTLELSFLKEMFSLSSQAYNEIRTVRDSCASVTSGSMILLNSLSTR